jgi:hypothetical protein
VFTDFYTAYWWLYNHPIFQERFINDEKEEWCESHFDQCLDIYVAKVNPQINVIDDDGTKNTKVQIWLETGKWNPEYGCHDIELDCGADTFEEAIIELAKLVMEWYGETKDRIKKSDWEDN